jgi:hypothetical protein
VSFQNIQLVPEEVRQIADPAVMVFDLNKDKLLVRHDLMGDVLQDSSVLTSIVSSVGVGVGMCIWIE